MERLVRERIIESVRSDCTLGSPGHPPGERVATAAENASEILELVTNGLELRIPARDELFFSPEGGAPWVTCIACNNRLSDGVMFEALTTSAPVACPVCRDARPIESWTVHDGAFGNLALLFCWELRPDFIARARHWAETPLVLVHYRI